MSAGAPFTIVEASGSSGLEGSESSESPETAVIVEIPHAGLLVDGPALATVIAPARAIGRDADLYVDELYADAPARGASLLVSHVSRYVCDLNRSEADLDADAIDGAPRSARATRGIVWRLTGDGGRVLERPIPRAELDRRLETYYRPYHRALAGLIEKKRARFGFAVVLAAHSMPSTAREPTRDARDANAKPAARADVVPGTRRGTSAAPVFIAAVDAHARDAELSVAHDDPYQGGYTTQHYGRPDRGVHVVQVELARRLYMDEDALSRGAGFDAMRAWCAGLVTRLGRTSP